MKNQAIIKHIEFWVSNLKRSVKFYKNLTKLIGWKHIAKNAIATFSNGQTKIYFVEQNVKLQNTVGPRHICFLASSRKVVDNVSKFLVKNKSNIIRGPIESIYKNRSSYTVDFRDPDGYIIEVTTKSVKI